MRRRWTLGHLGYVLKIRCYICEIVHRGAIYPANHEPIVAGQLFEDVQERLAAQSIERRVSARPAAYLLQGLLFDYLAFLSPKIIQSIVQGVAPATWTPSRLTDSMPIEWQEQERLTLPALQSGEPVSV